MTFLYTRHGLFRSFVAINIKRSKGGLIAKLIEIDMTIPEKSDAKLMETDPSADRTKAIAAAQRIKILRKNITLGEGLTIRELIDEGRR